MAGSTNDNIRVWIACRKQAVNGQETLATMSHPVMLIFRRHQLADCKHPDSTYLIRSFCDIVPLFIYKEVKVEENNGYTTSYAQNTEPMTLKNQSANPLPHSIQDELPTQVSL